MKSFVYQGTHLIALVDGYVYKVKLTNWAIDLYHIQQGIRAHNQVEVLGLDVEWPRICRELKDEKYV